MKAKDIMSQKVATISRDAVIEDAVRIMNEKNISGIPVVDDGKVVGIVTQKDLLYRNVEPRFPGVFQVLGGVFFLMGEKYNEELRKVLATKVEDVMTRDVIAADEDTEVEEVARLMIDKGINRVPVLRNGKLAGIISRADIVRYIGRRP